MPCICFSDFYCHARRHFLNKQRGYHTKKHCHTSHVTYPDPATTRIRPGSNDRVPGSGTRRNSLPVPSLIIIVIIIIIIIIIIIGAYSFSVVRLNNIIININKPMEFEAFTDRALLIIIIIIIIIIILDAATNCLH